MTEKTALIGKIAILPTPLINQIAAGEVIERPASVVKELMENSIDAGSTRIEVDIKTGGRLLIRVRDDGEGMCKEDALLAFQRHATSKIRTDRDLLSIQTLGFRGEALPSIGAVSKVRLVTSPRGGKEEEINVATEVLLEGGQILKVQEASALPGTLIEVREIFFNTPARLKFLKSVATELGHISRLLQQQALAHPHISFSLSHEGKQLLDLPSVPDRMFRVQQVYGRALSEHLLCVAAEWAKIKIWGAVSKPPYTKGTRAYQEIFVNRRHIASPFILHAVYEAYGTALMRGQHPVVLLFLEMEGQMLDVNVHPTKREVRFHDPKLIYDLIKECIKTGLQETSRTGLGLGDRVQEAAATYLRTHSVSPGVEWRSPKEKEAGWVSHADRGTNLTAVSLAGQEQAPLPEFVAEMIPLGQVYDTFILARVHGELWIVDQHAAHERVLYERFLKDAQKGRTPSQRLLIPQTLELSMTQVMILREIMDQLESLGLEIESFGPQSMMIRTVPIFLGEADLQGLIMDLIEDWMHLEKISSAEDRQKNLVATMACHGAVKANEALTVTEMESLLKDVLQLPATTVTCPHGRPFKVKFVRKELETMFRR
jgi:DNA mismatch repair protein MutL